MKQETKEAIRKRLDQLVEGSDKAADPILATVVRSKWTGVIVTAILILLLILYVA